MATETLFESPDLAQCLVRVCIPAYFVGIAPGMAMNNNVWVTSAERQERR
jgi:hypothetical protein